MRTLLLEGPGPFHLETLLGALCDLGAAPSTVEWELGKLYLAAYHLHFERGEGGGVRFTVHPGTVHTHDQDDEGGAEAGGHAHAHAHHGRGDREDHGHHYAHDDDEEEENHHGHGHEGEETDLTDVVGLIERSDLSSFVRPRAVEALGNLGEDFSEDEALMAVVGVVGVLAAFEALEVGALFCGVQLFPQGLDQVSKALLDTLNSRPVAPGSVSIPGGRTGVGLGRRAGESLRATLGERA